MRVLLIEDDSATAQSIELMLKSESFNVYTTDLGEEGVDLGKLYDYDIILLDLNLPDMHGYDVLKKLRVAKVQTPVLILSGISEMDSKVRSFGFGADDYVTKPFKIDEVRLNIANALRSKNLESEVRILKKELVKVPETEHQQSVWNLLFDPVILPHQRRGGSSGRSILRCLGNGRLGGHGEDLLSRTEGHR